MIRIEMPIEERRRRMPQGPYQMALAFLAIISPSDFLRPDTSGMEKKLELRLTGLLHAVHADDK
jgi:hypothetical protein